MRFTYFFVSNTTHRFTQTISVKYEHNTCRHENFWNRISKFFREGVIFPKTEFCGVLRYTCSTCAAALAFSPTANLSIVPYSRRPGMFASRVTFFDTTCRSLADNCSVSSFFAIGNTLHDMSEIICVGSGFSKCRE